MSHKPNANLLLVEGKDELRVIPHLVEKNGVTWSTGPGQFCVEIIDLEGVENVLDPVTLSAYAKRSELERLGILIDANGDTLGRWEEVRRALVSAKLCDDGDVPITLPIEGLILALPRLVVGVWLMPNNSDCGMLETFLQHLIRDSSKRLWEYTLECCEEAQRRGGRYKHPQHLDKARIHTWLAWQDDPGRQLHQALIYEFLDPKCAYATAFVDWFCKLYALPRSSPT